jgi:hypothetical protein
MIEVGMELQVIDTPIQLKEVSAPATPYANKLKLYAKDKSGASALYYMNDAGTEFDLSLSVPHPILSSTYHSDTLTGTVVRGDLIVGNSTPKWSRLARGSSGQYIKTNSSGDLAWATIDHGSEVTGLGDDDHTIYALLLGRSGGQTLIGGTAASNSLTLTSTSHGTKGGIGLGSAPTSIHGTIVDEYVQIKRASGGNLQIVSTATADASSLGEIDIGSSGASASDKRGVVLAASLDGSGVTNPSALLALYINNAGAFYEAQRWHKSGALGFGGANYGSAGSYLRSAGSGSPVVWSTLILPNAATANRLVYASASNTYGESANLTYDGTDFGLGSGTRARMQSQNRFRFLNTMASVKMAGDQTLTTATVTTVNFGAEDVDTDVLHDNSSSNSRITVALTGKYIIGGVLNYAANGTGVRQIRLHQDGSATPIRISSIPGMAGDNARPAAAWLVSASASAYFELKGYQDSGGDLTLSSSAPNCHFWAVYVGE